MKLDRRHAMVLTAALLAQDVWAASIVPPALERPALAIRAPARAVLLAACAAGARLVAVGEHGVVILSDDQGATWRQARAVPTSVSLATVRFADEHKGWAAGHAGVILHTADGGETWTRQADGRSLAQAAVAVSSRSADERQSRSAQRLLDDGPDKPLLDIVVFDAHHAMVVGAYGLAFETVDGGKSWSSVMDRLDNPKGLHLNAIQGDGETLYVAGEQGVLLRSDDRGRNFRRLPTPYAGSWFTLAVPHSGAVIAAGLRGNAFISSDKGASWRKLEGAAPASYVSAAIVGKDNVVLANQAGQLVSTTVGGRLETLQLPPLPPTSALVALPSGGLLAVGMAGAMRLPGPLGAGAAR
jgi:photosystem II stability/assembly factor-like uncharacterized protein